MIFALVQSGFGADVRGVVERRADHRASGGLARGHGQRIIFARDLIEVQRRRQPEAASARLSAERGLAPRQKASMSPASVASVWRKFRGLFAIVDDGLVSSLFPGGRALEQHLDRPRSGVMMLDRRINWSFGLETVFGR